MAEVKGAGTVLQDEWKAEGVLNAIDRQFADLMLQLDGGSSPELWLAAALASHVVQKGNVCLDLKSAAGKPWQEEDSAATLICPPCDVWLASLQGTKPVGRPGEFKPLILDGSGRLYLHRYWRYERILVEFFRSRIRAPDPEVDLALLRSGLDRLFPGYGGEQPDYQRVAALAAPTGKAAARLRESVKKAKREMPCPAGILDLIPEEVSTLHRLLGWIPHSTRFRFDQSNPLPFEAVVVDEASMIDLPLMAKLARALPAQCRLILLGDRDQLASVQPGAVFGDICGAGELPGWSMDFARLVEFNTILNLANVPTGTYSQIKLTLANPQLTMIDVFADPPAPVTITTSLVNTRLLPSGANNTPDAPWVRFVTCFAFPPSASASQTCGVPLRVEMKAILLESGDQRGRSLLPSRVICRGSPPKTGTTQIWRARLFRSKSRVDTVNATVLPSGETCGSPSRASRNMA